MASFTRAKPLLLLLLLSSLRAGEGAPNTAALSMLCNRAVYGVGDPFAASVAYVLAELLDDTPASSGRETYNVSPYPNAFAYGHAACRGGVGGLAAADCASCLASAMSQMNATCGHAIGARAVLVDCKARYEQYAFVD